MRFMIGSSLTGASLHGQVLQVGYRSNTELTWGQMSNDYNITVPAYSENIARLHSLVFNSLSSAPKIYYLNGGLQNLENSYGDTVGNSGLTSYLDAALGLYALENGHYQGNIGEIIIFNRGLKNEERQAIENYLSKKWGIKIS